jgi:hypothetical protein
MSFARAAPVALFLVLSACINTDVGEAGPSFEAVTLLRAAPFKAASVGTFTNAKVSGMADRSINIRGSTMKAPGKGTFADYLAASIQSELKASGKYDPAAPASISGRIVENDAGENFKRGNAALAAEFSVSRGGAVRFSRTYRVTHQWDSAFMAVTAVPQAFNHYSDLYPKLIAAAFRDPEFVAALGAD